MNIDDRHTACSAPCLAHTAADRPAPTKPATKNAGALLHHRPWDGASATHLKGTAPYCLRYTGCALGVTWLRRRLWSLQGHAERVTSLV